LSTVRDAHPNVNRGGAHITSWEEREQLAELNLVAGKACENLNRLQLGAYRLNLAGEG
jgi:hypothetical protein